MAVAGSIVVDLLMKTGSFETDANRAAKSAEKNAKAMSRAYENAGRAIGTGIRSAATQLLAFAGVSLGVGAAIGAIKDAIDKADSIRDLSIRIGASTETLSAFGYAAAQTGTDIDTLGKGMKILAKNAAAALNPTSAQAKIFEALGISVTDASGNLKQMGELIPEIADKFKGLQDGTTKAALAQALFGKSGLELTEFLNSGSDGLKTFTDRARELGIVIGKDTADAADKFNDDLNDLKTAAEGLALKVAQTLMPELDKLVVWASDFVSDGANAEAAAHGIAAGFQDMAQAANSLGQIIGFLQKIHDLLAESDRLAQSLAGGQNGIIGVGAGALKKKFPFLYRNIGSSQPQAANDSNFNGPSMLQVPVLNGQQPFDATAGRFSVVPHGTSGGVDSKALALALSNPSTPKAKKEGESDAEKASRRLQAAYADLIAQQNEQIALFGKTSEAAKARYDTEFGALKGLSQEKKAEVIANAEKLDQMQEESDLQKQLDDINKQRLSQVNDVLASIADETTRLSLNNEQQEIFNNLKAAGVDANSAWGQSIIANTEQLQKLREQAAFMDDVKESLSGAFTDFITGAKSAKDAFGDFADHVYQTAVKWLADRAIQALFDGFGNNSSASAVGGSSGGTNWGSLIASFFGGGRAGGGDVMSGGAYLVGENGPEMFVPRTAGTVLTHEETMGRSGGTSKVVQNYFSMSKRNDNRSERQIAQATGRAIRMA